MAEIPTGTHDLRSVEATPRPTPDAPHERFLEVEIRLEEPPFTPDPRFALPYVLYLLAFDIADGEALEGPIYVGDSGVGRVRVVER